jgi:phosphocarrier protein HPr
VAQCSSDDGKENENMIQQELEIINKLGLHARASAKFTQLAAKYKSEVWLTRNGRRINAKSIMGVMMLAAGKGAKVTLEADGADEQDAITALSGLVNDKFGEGE